MSHENISIERAHHVAYRCKDAEETRAFYEDLLGLPLAHVVRDAAGEIEFLHLFFALDDGTFLAFFDVAEETPDETYKWKDGLRDYHYAMEVKDMDTLTAMMERLKAADVMVFGPIDHGFVHSIYFWDPNGVALEFTCRDENYTKILTDEGPKASDSVAKWMAEKVVKPKAEAPAG